MEEAGAGNVKSESLDEDRVKTDPLSSGSDNDDFTSETWAEIEENILHHTRKN